MFLATKKFGAVDIESTGQHLTRNAMIAFGFSIQDGEEKELDTFVAYLSVPEGREWEKRCVDEFWSKEQDTLAYITERMKDPKEEMERFATWLDEMDTKYKGDLVVLSDNGGYDYAWIDEYLSAFTKRPSIYYRLKGVDAESGEKNYGFRRTWDTNSMYHGALTELRPTEYIQWSLEKELGNKQDTYKHDHNPLNDARCIALDYIRHRKDALKRKNCEVPTTEVIAKLFKTEE